jgi:hypothetical protein
MKFENKTNSQTALQIFYQNIRGLKHKTDGLMYMLDSFDHSPDMNNLVSMTMFLLEVLFLDSLSLFVMHGVIKNM